MARCEFSAVAASDVVPLSMTEAMISSATAAMLAARACISGGIVVICGVGASVKVANCVVVTVVNTRTVEVDVVVDPALVVIVLDKHQIDCIRLCDATNIVGVVSTTSVAG